jgi:hypothetical protein
MYRSSKNKKNCCTEHAMTGLSQLGDDVEQKRRKGDAGIECGTDVKRQG